MMEKFLKKEAFGIDAMGILFKDDLDDDEEELQEIKDRQVLLVSEYPASSTDEKAYYEEEEFYNYLKIFINKNYSKDDRLQELLREINIALKL